MTETKSKKQFRVAVTELYRKCVLVEADTENEALRRTEDAWRNSEIILNERNFEGSEYYVLGEGSGDESEKSLERIEAKDG